MAQKTNPHILRLGKTIDWKYQYFEKKAIESSTYTFKNLEIENFITQFFKINGLIVQDIKLYYFESALHMFVSYFLSEKIKRVQYKNKQIKIKKRYLIYYKKLKYKKKLHKKINTIFFTKFRKRINNKKNKFLKYLKGEEFFEDYGEKVIQANSENWITTKYFFFKKLFESVKAFLKKQINISLTLKQENRKTKKIVNEKEQETINRNVAQLRTFNRKENLFFKEGVNLLFACIKTKNSAKLLSKFIAFELKPLKWHKYLLNFVQNTLKLFFKQNYSNCEGIKIEVKGRFNGALRAKRRRILIGNGVPLLTLNSKIDYAESIAFTQNGTFGVKVWVNEKNSLKL